MSPRGYMPMYGADEEDPYEVLAGIDPAALAMPVEEPPAPVASEPIVDDGAIAEVPPAVAEEPALSPMEALAQRLSAIPASSQPARRAPQLPDPPMRSGNAAGPMVAAGLLDLFLNKGRNAGLIVNALGTGGDEVAYENYRRKVDAAKAQSALDNAYAYGGRGTRGMTPEQIALQQARLGQAGERLKIQQDEAKRKATEAELNKKKWEEANSVDSATSRAAQDLVIKYGGVPEADARKQNAAQLYRAGYPAVVEMFKNSGIVGDARTAQSAETASAVSAATLDDRIKIAREGALARGQAEGQSPAFAAQQEERYRASADQYANRTDNYRKIGQQVQRIRGITDKYKGKDLPGLGPVEGRMVPNDYYAAKGDTDALEIRNAQQLMRDIVQRAQSGAAAPVSEVESIKLMTGARDGASEAEFQIGLEAVQEYAIGQMRAYSAGREDAAREVLRLQGLEDFVFPKPKQPKTKPAGKGKPAKPAAARKPLTADEEKSLTKDLF